MQAALLKSEAEKRQINEAMSLMIQSEVRRTATDIYTRLIVQHFNDPELDIAKIKTCAAMAAKCAPYLHQSLGVISVDDEAIWGQSPGAASNDHS